MPMNTANTSHHVHAVAVIPVKISATMTAATAEACYKRMSETVCDGNLFTYRRPFIQTNIVSIGTGACGGIGVHNKEVKNDRLEWTLANIGEEIHRTHLVYTIKHIYKEISEGEPISFTTEVVQLG